MKNERHILFLVRFCKHWYWDSLVTTIFLMMLKFILSFVLVDFFIVRLIYYE